MMAKYKVRSDRAQTITGLGVFEEGEERDVTEQEAESFTRITGLSLEEGNVPEGVTVESSDEAADEKTVPPQEIEIVEQLEKTSPRKKVS